jgi:cell division protein FtsI/penicillin-binding protein 2
MTSRRSLLLAWAAPSPACVVALRVRDGSIARIDNERAAAERLLPPGSAVKPISLAGLTKTQPAACQPRLRISGHVLDCTHVPQIGPIDAETALAASCNSWFARMARQSDPAWMHRTLLRSGADAQLARSLDELQLQTLGLAAVRYSPLRLAEAYRRIALSQEIPVRRALARAVREGTAQLAAIDQLTVAGKTGTTPTSSWFAGYAPANDPRIVVVVQLPYGRGGSDAAPLARAIFEWWRNSSSR